MNGELVEAPQIDSLAALSLAELAAETNEQYKLGVDALRRSWEHGIRTGEALLEARSRHTGNGDWLKWCEENLEFGYRDAARFMRWAHYKDQVPVAEPYTQRREREVLHGLPALPRNTWRFVIEEGVRDEAVALWKGGMTKVQIAKKLDISKDSVDRFVRPDAYAKKKMLAARERRRKQAAATKALEQKERAESVRRCGGDVSVAYGQLRKAAAAIDAALPEAATPEIRACLRAALSHVHKAEDEIGKAVRGA